MLVQLTLLCVLNSLTKMHLPPPTWPPKLEFEPQPGFGDYLRRLRLQRGLTLREAATIVGISHGYLGKLERGQSGYRPIRLEYLERAADLLGVARHEMLTAAGYKDVAVRLGPRDFAELLGEPPDRTVDLEQLRARFRAVVLHPKVRPGGLSDEALHYIPARLLVAWVEFAERLERHLRSGGDSIEVLMRDGQR